MSGSSALTSATILGDPLGGEVRPGRLDIGQHGDPQRRGPAGHCGGAMSTRVITSERGSIQNALTAKAPPAISTAAARARNSELDHRLPAVLQFGPGRPALGSGRHDLARVHDVVRVERLLDRPHHLHGLAVLGSR